MKISCKMCGANLKYVPSIQKACCEHCGNIFSSEEIIYDESIYEECEQHICSSCGAEIMSFGKTGVIRCMYCGGNEFVKGKENKQYILQGIFPFKVDREQFIESYKKHIKMMPDVDKKFVEKLNEADIKSVYLPYSFANSFFRKQYVEKLNSLLESIIPFNFKELKNMNPIYLDNCLVEVVKTKKEENDIKTDDPSFYLVPIWLAEVEYEDNIYYIVMNGQTWEMAGYYYNKNSKSLKVSKEEKKDYNYKKRKIIKKLVRTILELILIIVLFFSVYYSRAI